MNTAKTLNSIDDVAKYYAKVHEVWSDKMLSHLIENSDMFNFQVKELTETIATFNQTCKDQIRQFFFVDIFDGEQLKKHSSLISFVMAVAVVSKWVDDRFASKKAKQFGIRVNCFFKVCIKI